MRRSTPAAMLMLCGTGALAHGQPAAYPRFVYAPGGTDCPRVYQYRVDAGGHKVPLSPPSVPTLGSVSSVAVSPDRRSVYVPEGDYFDIAQFHVRRDGTLAPMRQPHVAADAHPTAFVLSPDGRHAYASCSHGDICQYRVRPDGALVPLAPRAVSIAAGGVRDPSGLSFSPGARSATVRADGAATGDVLFRFRVRHDGRLVPAGRAVRGEAARPLEVDGVWWSNRRILTVTDWDGPGLAMTVGEIHNGRARPLPRLTAALRACDGRGDWAVSPDGRRLLGVGFGPPPATGISGGMTCFALDLHSLAVRRWPRLGEYARLTWAADSRSWFDVAPTSGGRLDGLQFFLDSPRVRRFPLGGVGDGDDQIIADDHGRLLIGSSLEPRDTAFAYRWADVRRPARALPQGSVALPPGYHVAAADYAPATHRLYLLSYHGPDDPDGGRTGSGYFVAPMARGRFGPVSGGFHVIGGGRYAAVSASPDGRRLLFCSDSAWRVVTPASTPDAPRAPDHADARTLGRVHGHGRAGRLADPPGLRPRPAPRARQGGRVRGLLRPLHAADRPEGVPGPDLGGAGRHEPVLHPHHVRVLAGGRRRPRGGGHRRRRGGVPAAGPPRAAVRHGNGHPGVRL